MKIQYAENFVICLLLLRHRRTVEMRERTYIVELYVLDNKQTNITSGQLIPPLLSLTYVLTDELHFFTDLILIT